jgi:hypothetical protein
MDFGAYIKYLEEFLPRYTACARAQISLGIGITDLLSVQIVRTMCLLTGHNSMTIPRWLRMACVTHSSSWAEYMSTFDERLGAMRKEDIIEKTVTQQS